MYVCNSDIVSMLAEGMKKKKEITAAAAAFTRFNPFVNFERMPDLNPSVRLERIADLKPIVKLERMPDLDPVVKVEKRPNLKRSTEGQTARSKSTGKTTKGQTARSKSGGKSPEYVISKTAIKSVSEIPWHPKTRAEVRNIDENCVSTLLNTVGTGPFEVSVRPSTSGMNTRRRANTKVTYSSKYILIIRIFVEFFIFVRFFVQQILHRSCL